jgi:hypothetical protein
MEWWSIGIEITKNVCKKISNRISGVLSFGFSITPTLQHSNTPILHYSITPTLQYSRFDQPPPSIKSG